ncbi:MAG: NAD-dependent epimerase/dehydratase family protein, partial [Geodermatophilaceae bacterium]
MAGRTCSDTRSPPHAVSQRRVRPRCSPRLPGVKVLVAGGAGYIGSVVTAALLEAGHEAVVLDDLSTG